MLRLFFWKNRFCKYWWRTDLFCSKILFWSKFEKQLNSKMQKSMHVEFCLRDHFSKFGVKSQILNLFFFCSLVACSQFKIFNKSFEFFVVSTFLILVCLFTTKISFKRYQKKTLVIFFAYFLGLFNKKNLIIPWKKIWKEKLSNMGNFTLFKSHKFVFFIFKYIRFPVLGFEILVFRIFFTAKFGHFLVTYPRI